MDIVITIGVMILIVFIAYCGYIIEEIKDDMKREDTDYEDSKDEL